ncbi:MAG: two-component regulator propeller domain-containing protein [Spirosomataceae bacterium]
MNKMTKLINLIFILTLNFSCVEKKSVEGETNTSELEATSKKDTLKFTSGIHSIFQDSKGNYWFGIHNTYAGVFGYNGSEFTIINDETLRLTEDSEKMHVRTILEDSQGRLWIGNNGIGVMLKSGNSIINFSKEQGKLIPMNEFEANAQSKQFTKNTGLQAVFAITEDS